MKVLTVCEDGINRSVAARWLLQHEGHEVIAVGIDRVSQDTLDMLCDWADRIILLTNVFSDIRPAHSDKLLHWYVGPPALYPHHLNRELVARLRLLWLQDHAKFDSGPRE